MIMSRRKEIQQRLTLRKERTPRYDDPTPHTIYTLLCKSAHFWANKRTKSPHLGRAPAVRSGGVAEEKTQLCQFIIVQLSLPLPLPHPHTTCHTAGPSPIAPSHFHPLRMKLGLQLHPWLNGSHFRSDRRCPTTTSLSDGKHG